MRILTFLLFLSLSTQAFSNVAQPGIWNAGGAGKFFLLYPEDSTAFKNIQMVQELVKVQLYQGFAVVKGVYQMHNPTADTLSLRMGYPINASFDPSPNSRLTQVRFDDLYDLQVWMAGEPVEVALSEVDVYTTGLEAGSNWYVWESHFPPGGITTFQVNFIVNTNDASVREGYDKSSYNAFIYLVESGSTWKQPIGKGTILVQLMGGLTVKDIRGIAPAGRFQVNEAQNILVWDFADLTPTHADNPILTYSERQPAFDFASVLSKGTQGYYHTLNQLTYEEVADMALQNYDFGDPFDPGTSGGSMLVGALFFLAMYGMPLILIISAIILGVYFYRRWRKRQDP